MILNVFELEQIQFLVKDLKSLYLLILLVLISLLTISYYFNYYRLKISKSRLETNWSITQAKIIRLERELLKREKQLTSNQLKQIDQEQQILEAKRFIIDVRKKVADSEMSTKLRLAERTLLNAGNIDSRWKEFIHSYTKVNPGFLNRLKQNHPQLSRKEMRLAALVSLNLSNKEIASLTHVAIKTIEVGRYRLRKKLELSKNESLLKYLVEVQNQCSVNPMNDSHEIKNPIPINSKL